MNTKAEQARGMGAADAAKLVLAGIVLVAGIVGGLVAVPLLAVLNTAVRYLAADLGTKKIRVNAISAGPINTLAARGVGDLSTMRSAQVERSPLHRNVDQSEVGGTALFLASPLASAVTGETIYVDCGFNIMGF